MNPHILMVIDNQLNPDKYIRKQLKRNADDAYDFYVTYGASYVYSAAAYAAHAADSYSVVDADDDANYWLNQYFEYTGENKQDYIDALENKQ